MQERDDVREFGGDLAGAVFWGADLTGAVFRDVDLTGARISHAWLVDIDIDALVRRLVINGVDVTDFVNERDPWFPLRAMLTPDTPDAARATWAALDAAWAATIADAATLADDRLHESVDGEWSFVESLRHVVFAIDKWLTVPIRGERFDPIGLPNSGSADFAWPGIDPTLRPTTAEALDAQTARFDTVRLTLDALTADDLGRTADVLENGPHSWHDCLLTVFEEAFWHNRYARRDLARLGAST